MFVKEGFRVNLKSAGVYNEAAGGRLVVEFAKGPLE